MRALDKLTESQFHTVWTNDVGMDGYEKKHYQNLLRKLKRRDLIAEDIETSDGKKQADTEANEINILLCVGDLIEFNHLGQLKRGRIEIVGKHGYWIGNTSGSVGNGSIRCDFSKAVLIG